MGIEASNTVSHRSAVKFGARTHLRLNDLQISHLNTRRGKVRNFKLHADGSLGLSATADTTHAAAEASHHTTSLLVVAAHTWQAQLCTHEKLLAASELLDLPHDGARLGRVVHGTDVCAELGCVGVFGHGDRDLHVVCR